MNDAALAALHARLAALERRQRRVQQAGVLLVIGLAALALVGQAPAPGPAGPKTVEAETFIVRDRAGRARAAMSIGLDDKPGIALADARGKIRLWLTVATDGAPEMKFYDIDEVVRASLSLDASGMPHLTLADKRGNARARLELGAEAAPSLALYDRADKVRASLAVDAADFAVMGITDNEGRARATMGVRAFGLPVFALTGRDGKMVWKAP